MLIKIIKCSDVLFWYNSYIGSTFEAYREYKDQYLARAPDGYSNIIKKIDCEVVQNEPQVSEVIVEKENK